MPPTPLVVASDVDFKLMSDMNNKSGKSYTLGLANRLYGDQSYQFLNAGKHYDTQLEPTALAVASNTFSLSLFKQLTEKNNASNVFYSPLSIFSALAMVLLGARGNTATQMSEVLYFKDGVHTDFSKLMSDLNIDRDKSKSYALSLVNRLYGRLYGEKFYALSLANRLYGDQSYQLNQEFLSATRKHYGAQLEPVDFIGNAEGARLNVNSWVEKQTQSKIKDLLAPGVVDGRTRLVLANAIYFKAKWDKSFHEHRTRDEQFRLSKTESKPVKMMYQTSTFPLAYIPEVKCQVVELPYIGKDLSMLIFLPDEMEDDRTGLEALMKTLMSLPVEMEDDTFDDTTGLVALENNLTYERFVHWTNPNNMWQKEVLLGLPRFKMEETYDMKDTLIKMGMVDAFDEEESDFSGMSPANDLVLSKVVHKAFVEVNEEGTEAAAASAGVITFLSQRPRPRRFIADHPFLFFIRHNPTMSILFAGRYCSPP